MRTKRFPSQQWLQHDRTQKTALQGGRDVTVCVATLFSWNYGTSLGGPPKYAQAGIVVSDRMITAGDVTYEPHQTKMAKITPLVHVLIAGDYPAHSQVILDTEKLIKGSSDQSPENVARMYGKSIQKMKQREAEDLYLAPLGMNSDTFIAQQKDMSDNFINDITRQLQAYEGQEMEAIVIGSDGEHVHLYLVDTRGIAHCMNDVGFAAIGIGAWHAKSHLMQVQYAKSAIFAPSLAAAYSAKRKAEIAPGVGKRDTDSFLFLKNNVGPIWPELAAEVKRLYDQYEEASTQLIAATTKQLQDFVVDPKNAGSDGGSPPIDAGAAQTAPETARKNEARQAPQGNN